ncbi:hypothetical protein RJ640_029884 [Escallonia rubra]|uniref:F-box domain-containing protein n=1 Tax=Escallonia rubra TaxID=112253 RepID=A0AA88UML7_9ASTE|nr:hypothetical protein RJ640_029884 [Escallonia rubra]
MAGTSPSGNSTTTTTSRISNQSDGGCGSGGDAIDPRRSNARKRRHLSQSQSQSIQVSRLTTTTKPSMNQLTEPDLDIVEFEYDLRYLPESLLLEILVRLPVKSLFRFKCVCKHWLSLVAHHTFSRSYISRRLDSSSLSFRIFYRYIYVSEFPEILARLRPDVYVAHNFSVLFLSTFEEQQQADQFKILAWSNGLILCCLLGPLIYYVCDPVTRQWVTLPRGRHNAPNRHPIFFGEGLVSRINEENVLTSFKAVRVEWLSVESNFLNLETYSSETGEWVDYRLFCPKPIRLLKRGGGPIHFNGILHWFVYEHGMVAFDPYKDTKRCRLIQFPEDRDVDNEYKYDGLYRLCDECQGTLRYFEVAPEPSEYFCFSMWILRDYEKGEWSSEFRVTRSDLWTNDAKISSSLMHATFVPLSFHPFNLDVVYLRCVERSCIVSYNITSKRLDISCPRVGVVEDLSWRVVIPFVLPMWPTPVPVPSSKAVKHS